MYLSERELKRLERLARTTGRSQAAIIREAIASYDLKPKDRDFALFDSGEGPGCSIADVPEEELLKGFGE